MFTFLSDNYHQFSTKVFPNLPPESQAKIIENCEKADDVTNNGKQLRTILFLLKSLSVEVLSKSSTFMSVKEYRAVKMSIEKVTLIGIIPCLQPEIGVSLARDPALSARKKEDLTDLVKYDRLSYTVRVLTECFDEISLKPAILTQLGPLLSGLFQLAHATLMKPTNSTTDPSKFQMTEILFNKLTNDQLEFRKNLQTLIENCQLSTVMKELMVLFGARNSPRWLQKYLKTYLVDGLMKPTGVVSLFTTTCDNALETRTYLENIDTISKLVTTLHGQDPDKYYTSICSQILNLFESKNPKKSFIIINSCIVNLYKNRPDVCQEKIINIIVQPLMIKIKKLNDDLVLQEESKISVCIENIHKLLTAKEARFPCELIKHISCPLFYMYIKSQKSVSLTKSQVKDILIILLSNDSLSESLFSVYLEPVLNHQEYFGEKLAFRFGPSGGLEIISRPEKFDYEEVADALYDLVIDDEDLSVSLFHYLLKSIHNNMTEPEFDENHQIEDMNMILKRIAITKLMSKLASNSNLQKAQIKNPKYILDFVKSLFNELMKKGNVQNENETEVLYVSLMLVKLILEQGKPKELSPFNELASYLESNKNKMKLSESFLTLISELLSIIKKKEVKTSRYYQDTSIDYLKEKEFEEALKDLTDPLLPVRAHGLMILTKKIEASDSIAIGKKDLLLYLFQENLKDDDSFMYLTAINGLCVMASKWPQELIEIIVSEFQKMPDTTHEIPPENRVKLGEILMKTTRQLGEMAPVYKNILINGFLCGTRDPDSMVRASSLSCLGELCGILGFRLGHAITEILLCIGCIIETDKAPEARRAAVMVSTLLIRGLGRDALTELGSDLVKLYRGLKHLRDNDGDEVLRLHAQQTLEEFDDIVQNFLFSKPSMIKNVNLRI